MCFATTQKELLHIISLGKDPKFEIQNKLFLLNVNNLHNIMFEIRTLNHPFQVEKHVYSKPLVSMGMWFQGSAVGKLQMFSINRIQSYTVDA